MFCREEIKSADLRADYANRADFCEVFDRELRPLYLLAFLLTANHKRAEQCFVSTLDEALEQTAVFKDWAGSWVKRCLIKNAIRSVRPTSARSSEKKDFWSGVKSATGGESGVDTVAQLSPLERFVLVMTVLERYSAWDCSVLLGCSPKKVAQEQMRALRRLPHLGAFELETRQSYHLQITA